MVFSLNLVIEPGQSRPHIKWQPLSNLEISSYPKLKMKGVIETVPEKMRLAEKDAIDKKSTILFQIA